MSRNRNFLAPSNDGVLYIIEGFGGDENDSSSCDDWSNDSDVVIKGEVYAEWTKQANILNINGLKVWIYLHKIYEFF